MVTTINPREGYLFVMVNGFLPVLGKSVWVNHTQYSLPESGVLNTATHARLWQRDGVGNSA